ncbi:MAG: hypothetical protein ACK5MV_01755 [Aminipila sp.]
MIVLPKDLSEIVKDPQKGIVEKPISILQLVNFTCEADYELNESVYNSAIKNVKLLQDVTADNIRMEFEKIISSKKAGKGIELLTKLGTMEYILGTEVAENMSKREMEDFNLYIENIDKTKQTRLRRLALFYRCFDNKRAEIAVKNLQFSEEDTEFLLDGIYLLEKLYFITNKYEMKKFLQQYGMERYEFLHNLSKAQRIVYDLPSNRIESRQYILDNIKEYNEPIFEEDLEITREDLIKEGIGKEQDYDRVFDELLDLVYIKPKYNNREDLLEYAKKYSKNKFAGAFKKIRYIK